MSFVKRHDLVYDAAVASGVFSTVQQFASRLRFPKLLAFTLGLLVVDILVPDLIPFVDEILLALLTALLASLKKQRHTPPR